MGNCVGGKWVCGDYNREADNTSTTNEDCLDGNFGFGPDFDCDSTDMYCNTDSGSGMIVTDCCPDQCAHEKKNKKDKADSESKGKNELERKQKRKENERKRKQDEKSRKNDKTQDEFLQKRTEKENKNKADEVERKNKKGWDESR